MILHPGIIALITGSVILLVMLLFSAFLGLLIILKWDMESSSASQLSLERRTYLISSVMSFVLTFEVLSIFLFIYTVDDLHRQFVGAMCATGSLNANPVGWYLLYLKIVLFFLSAIWIGINHVDQRAEGFPLVRFKYALLLIIAPLVAAEVYLMLRYFLNLNPNIITSCCGALFSGEGKGLSSTLASLPVRPMEYAFFLTAGLYMLICIVSLKLGKSISRYLVGLMSTVLFVVSIMAVISFISLYFYELPTHHCPFDILQGYYHYIGYPLYGSLFGASVLGMLVGMLEMLRYRFRDHADIERYQKRWTVSSMFLTTAFLLITLYQMIFSSLTLEGY